MSFLRLWLFLFICSVAFSQAKDYKPGEILVQFSPLVREQISITNKDGIALTGISPVDKLNYQFKVHQIRKLFRAPNPNEKAKSLGLELLYLFKFSEKLDIKMVKESYEDLREIKAVYPNAIFPLLYIPNDPRYSEEWHLPNIGCPEAWDITRGDTSVITAVVDVGIDYEHPDIVNNLWVNNLEDLNHNRRFDPDDLNGVDEDGNGYVDDVIGYDFSDYDPDPMSTFDHGTHIWGISSATTDNGIGVASIGFNIRGMALKCGDDAIFLFSAIEAILYAANNGAWVINMSWGSYYQYQPLQDAIEYAWQQGLVLAAGAGNGGIQTPLYPANYPYVIAVAASNLSNQKTSWSNYGNWIDVAAPGDGILSTITLNRYAAFSGTSMSSPCVIGLAALIKSAYPLMTNGECTLRIFQSCDSMPDPYYRSGLLGWGRINAAKALIFTGIEEERRTLDTKPSTLKIYPNPAKSVIRVRSPLSVKEIKIFDASGKLVRVEEFKSSGVNAELKISLERMKSGVYFVKVGKETEKLVIKR